MDYFWDDVIRIRTESDFSSAKHQNALKEILGEEARRIEERENEFEKRKNVLDEKILILENEYNDFLQRRKVLNERIARLRAALGLEKQLVVRGGILEYYRYDKIKALILDNDEVAWTERYFELLSLARDEDGTPLGPALQFYATPQSDDSKLLELILLHDCDILHHSEGTNNHSIDKGKSIFEIRHKEHRHNRLFRSTMKNVQAWLEQISQLIQNHAQELAHTTSTQHRNLRHTAIRSARNDLETIFGD